MSVIRVPPTPRGAGHLFRAVVAAWLLVLALVVPAGAVEGPTKLFHPAASARSGTPTTTITFTVIYRNREGSAPAYVRVVIDGAAHKMTGDGGNDWKGGVGHHFATKLPVGTHDVSFVAADTRKFTDAVDGGTVTISVPTPTPDPTPAPTPTPKPNPTPDADPDAARLRRRHGDPALRLRRRHGRHAAARAAPAGAIRASSATSVAAIPAPAARAAPAAAAAARRLRPGRIRDGRLDLRRVRRSDGRDADLGPRHRRSPRERRHDDRLDERLDRRHDRRRIGCGGRARRRRRRHGRHGRPRRPERRPGRLVDLRARRHDRRRWGVGRRQRLGPARLGARRARPPERSHERAAPADARQHDRRGRDGDGVRDLRQEAPRRGAAGPRRGPRGERRPGRRRSRPRPSLAPARGARRPGVADAPLAPALAPAGPQERPDPVRGGGPAPPLRRHERRRDRL